MAVQDEASQLGNEGDESIPYSQIADKHKAPGMAINPSDTDESSSAAVEGMPPTGPSLTPAVLESENPKTMQNPPQRHSAFPQRKTTKTTSGHERSAEHSPLHHQQARVANKDGGFSPSWEKKGSYDGIHSVAPTTPVRYRLRAGGQADESPEEASAVPEFGDWDENNPASADGFTGIFEKVRKEKQSGGTNSPMLIDDSVYLNSFHRDRGSKKSVRCFCCVWGKK